MGEGVIRLSTSGLNQEYKQRFQQNPEAFFRNKRAFESRQAEGLGSIWNNLCAADYRSVLPQIDKPSLLLYAGHSQYYPPDVADYVHQSIPGSQLVRLPQGDHSPFIQQPQEFAQAVRSFLWHHRNVKDL